MIEYRSAIYVYSLTITVVFLSLYNGFVLIYYSNLFAVIPLALQLTLLVLLALKKQKVMLIIKAWAIIIIFSGVAGWFSILATLGLVVLGEEGNYENLTLFNILTKSLSIVYPVYILKYLNRSIVKEKKILGHP